MIKIDTEAWRKSLYLNPYHNCRFNRDPSPKFPTQRRPKNHQEISQHAYADKRILIKRPPRFLYVDNFTYPTFSYFHMRWNVRNNQCNDKFHRKYNVLKVEKLAINIQ